MYFFSFKKKILAYFHETGELCVSMDEKTKGQRVMGKDGICKISEQHKFYSSHLLCNFVVQLESHGIGL